MLELTRNDNSKYTIDNNFKNYRVLRSFIHTATASTGSVVPDKDANSPMLYIPSDLPHVFFAKFISFNYEWIIPPEAGGGYYRGTWTYKIVELTDDISDNSSGGFGLTIYNNSNNVVFNASHTYAHFLGSRVLPVTSGEYPIPSHPPLGYEPYVLISGNNMHLYSDMVEWTAGYREQGTFYRVVPREDGSAFVQPFKRWVDRVEQKEANVSRRFESRTSGYSITMPVVWAAFPSTI